MESCGALLARFHSSDWRQAGNAAQAAALTGLLDALENNRPRPFTLWAWHYFVSPDCIIPTSVEVWNHPGSDIDIYQTLTDQRVADFATSKGYLSPWLIGLATGEKRRIAYQKALPSPEARKGRGKRPCRRGESEASRASASAANAPDRRTWSCPVRAAVIFDDETLPGEFLVCVAAVFSLRVSCASAGRRLMRFQVTVHHLPRTQALSSTAFA